jgi:hypothetical protein
MNAVAVVIAMFALLVSVFSAYVSIKKLRLDLFDRRYKIFEETWGALSTASVNIEGQLPKRLDNLLPMARFLLPKELYSYVAEVNSKLGVLYVIAIETQRNHYRLPPNRVEEHHELMQWLATEAQAGCNDRFAPYLDFARW